MVASGVSVELYDPTGVTRLAFLTDIARGVRWHPVLNKGNGTASFELPALSAKTALVTDFTIVKFKWAGKTFGVRVGDLEKCSLAVDGDRWIRYENLQGLGCLLGEANVYPEYGIARASGSVRRFGHMSRDVDRSTYTTPVGVRWEDDPTARSGYPSLIGEIAPRAMWISLPGPSTDVADGTENWIYGAFTVAADVSVKVITVFDNYGEPYLDGQLLVESTELYAWKDGTDYDTRLAAGEHLIAAHVRNAITTVGSNPVAFLCVVVTLNAAGEIDEDSDVIFKTNDTDWFVSTTEPGFSRAGVFALAIAEAQARNERGPDLLTVDFTATLDSDGDAITDRAAYELQTVAVGLDAVGAQMTESGGDWLVDADEMAVKWFNRYGSGLTSTVRLFLADNLTDYETTRTFARVTVAVGQLADGKWIEVVDTAGVAAYGRICKGFDLGTASTEATGIAILTAALEETSAPVVSSSASMAPYVGKQLGVDYWLGDTILKPGHRGVGTIAARCTEADIDATGEFVVATPTFQQDRSV